MDFAPAARTVALLSRLEDFMREHVYPAESVYDAELAAGGLTDWPGTIEMGLGVVKFGRTSVTFDQVVFSEGTCVASAQSVSVLLDEATRKPTPLTEAITGNFQRWLRRGTDGR